VKVSSEKVFIFKLVEGREKVVETLVYSDIITAQSLQIQVQEYRYRYNSTTCTDTEVQLV